MQTARVLAKTKDLTREQWLEYRRRGIGGSDVAPIAGLSPWRSRIHVYLEKLGQDSYEANEAMYWGNQLEELVAKEFARRTGMRVRKRHAILQHPKHDFMLANIDREIIGVRHGLECKTTNAFAAKDWQDDKVPEMYILQCQHYMAVTGFDAWHIAVLIGGNTFEYKTIARDNDIIENIIELEHDFWHNHVLKQEPPVVDGSSDCTKLMKLLYPVSDPDTVIPLDGEALDLIEQYERGHAEEKEAKRVKDEAANRLKYMLQENERGEIGERIVNWKGFVKNVFDKDAFKENHPDLYDKYLKQKQERRFTIK